MFLCLSCTFSPCFSCRLAQGHMMAPEFSLLPPDSPVMEGLLEICFFEGFSFKHNVPFFLYSDMHISIPSGQRILYLRNA